MSFDLKNHIAQRQETKHTPVYALSHDGLGVTRDGSLLLTVRGFEPDAMRVAESCVRILSSHGDLVAALTNAIKALNRVPSFDTRLPNPENPNGHTLTSYQLLPMLGAVLAKAGTQ